MDLRGRSLLREADLSRDEFLYPIDLASRCRTEKHLGSRRHRHSPRHPRRGKNRVGAPWRGRR